MRYDSRVTGEKLPQVRLSNFDVKSSHTDKSHLVSRSVTDDSRSGDEHVSREVFVNLDHVAEERVSGLVDARLVFHNCDLAHQVGLEHQHIRCSLN